MKTSVEVALTLLAGVSRTTAKGGSQVKAKAPTLLILGLAIIGLAFVIGPSLASTDSASGIPGPGRGNSALTWVNKGPFGGAVDTFAVSASDADYLYAIRGGRLTVTSTGGSQWTGVGKDANMVDVAVSGQNRCVAYAAENSTTGTNISLGYKNSIGGLHRTTDCGQSWTKLVMGDDSTRGVTAVAVYPQDDQMVFAALDWRQTMPGYVKTPSGLFKSTDGGGSWTNITPTGAISDSSPLLIRVDPNNSQALFYVTLAGSYFDEFRSIDGGKSWSSLGGYGGGSLLLYDMALAPGGNTVYRALSKPWSSGQSAGYDYVSRSTDGGTHWTTVLTSTDYLAKSVAVDPTNPQAQAVYAGNYRSADGGQNWSQMQGLPYPVVQIRAQSGKVYAWTYGGPYRSEDGGLSWTSLSAATPLKITSVAVDPTDSKVAYAASDDWPGVVLKTTNLGGSWTEIKVGSREAKTQDPRSCYAEYYLLHPTGIAADISDPRILWASSRCAYTFVTTDGGVSWKRLTFPPNYIRFDIVSSPISTSVAYVGSPYEVAKYITSTFVSLAAFTQTSFFDGVRLAVDANGRDLYVAANHNTLGGVYKAVNEAQPWVPSTAGLPVGANAPYAIATDPRNSGVLYVGISTGGTPAGVYKSNDGAQTWTAVNAGLIDQDVRVLLVDPVDSNTIYLGTNNGLYTSTNSGLTWQKDTTFGSKVVTDIAVGSNTPRTLYVGTTEGIWVQEEVPPTPTPTPTASPTATPSPSPTLTPTSTPTPTATPIPTPTATLTPTPTPNLAFKQYLPAVLKNSLGW